MNKIIIVAYLTCTTLFIIANTHQNTCKNKHLITHETAEQETSIYAATYPFTLPALPYAYNALEPYIDKQTMEIHHSKHHQAYVDNLNKALENQPALQKKSLFELLKELESLPENVRTAIRNQGGGHFNHSLFWTCMMPNAPKKPSGNLATQIDKTFGSFDKFQEEFNTKAKTVFGSGWAWLVTDPKGTLSVITTSNQDAPIANSLTPIIGLDVWEHAYYLKYQNRRPDYITAWWEVINWPLAEQTYTLHMQTAKKII